MTVGHVGEEISAIEKWPPSVRAQHAQVVAALEAKLRAAAHLDDARDDILAFTARGLAADVEQQSPGNDVFAGSLAIWWDSAKHTLPPEDKRLAVLADADLQTISSAYGDFYMRSAAISRTGRIRRVGPTAAAKLLYFVRSCTVTAWDEKISLRTGGGRDQGHSSGISRPAAAGQPALRRKDGN
jgi:hypothetical protein